MPLNITTTDILEARAIINARLQNNREKTLETTKGYYSKGEFLIFLDYPVGHHILFHSYSYSEDGAKDICKLLGIEIAER